MHRGGGDRSGAAPDSGEAGDIACPGCGGTDCAAETRYASAIGPRMECRIVRRPLVFGEIAVGALLTIGSVGALATAPPGITNLLWVVLFGLAGLVTLVHGLSTLTSGKVATYCCRQCGLRWLAR
jgi:uncharacterized membrane protein